MACYKHIIVGVDLSEDSSKVLARASELARACGATLSLAHVIEPLTFAYGGDMPIDLPEVQEQLQLKAQQELQRLGQRNEHPVKQEHVLVGQAANQLRHQARLENADLIIDGCRGRKGLAL